LHQQTFTNEKNSRKQNHQSQPWLTKHLLLQIQKKHRLYRKFHKNPQNLDIKHKLKSLCDAITHEKEKLKKQYFAQQFNNHQSNPAQTWNLVKKLMGKSHTKYIPNLITCPLTQNQTSDLQ